MSVLLAVTVGGSCQPVVTAIQDYRPDFVVFIVSTGSRGSRGMVDGEGSPCQIRAADGKSVQFLPNIVTQTGLPAGSWNFAELNDPDELNHCYTEIRKALNQYAAAHPGWRRIADYTGGTKTMSAALVLAALDAGWELSLVKGARTDLVRVVDGSEMAALAGGQEVRCRQRLAEARALFNNYAYYSAAELFESLARQAPLPPALGREVRDAACLARAFDAWDKFDHERAFYLLEPFQSRVVPQWIFLKSLLKAVKSKAGYEPVFDLLGNAERRAARGRYDDAAARLYRALELLAQTRLLQQDPPIHTGAVDLRQVPEPLRDDFGKQVDADGVLKIGLHQDYRLLRALHDPLGLAFDPLEGRLRDILTVRNQSILAHGPEPIRAGDYARMKNVVDALLEDGLKELKIRNRFTQFPQLSEDGLLQRSDAQSEQGGQER